MYRVLPSLTTYQPKIVDDSEGHHTMHAQQRYAGTRELSIIMHVWKPRLSHDGPTCQSHALHSKPEPGIQSPPIVPRTTASLHMHITMIDKNRCYHHTSATCPEMLCSTSDCITIHIQRLGNSVTATHNTMLPSLSQTLSSGTHGQLTLLARLGSIATGNK